MKKNLIATVIIGLLCIFSNTAYSLEEKYKIDPDHSFVVWRVSHLGFSTQTGKWPVNGNIWLDDQSPAKNKVDVTIKINSLITGNSELNKHLSEPTFFDEQKYPTATFVSERVEIISKNSATIYGKLNLHGVTKDINFKVTLNKKDKHPITEKLAVGYNAKTTIKRSDFGISGFIPMVGDNVELNMDVEAQKEN